MIYLVILVATQQLDTSLAELHEAVSLHTSDTALRIQGFSGNHASRC